MILAFCGIFNIKHHEYILIYKKRINVQFFQCFFQLFVVGLTMQTNKERKTITQQDERTKRKRTSKGQEEKDEREREREQQCQEDDNVKGGRYRG